MICTWALDGARQALGLVGGREFVVPDDVKRLALPVFAHRVISKSYLQSGQRDVTETIVKRLIEEVPVPK